MNQYLILAVALVGYVLYKYHIYPLYLSPLRKIPGPPVSNFILGHYATFLKNGLGYALAHLAKQYGGIVRFHGLFNKPYILIADSKLAQKILVNHPYDYLRSFVNENVARETFGEGILLANGDTHKRQRKMMNPSFAFVNIKEMVPTFVQAGHKLKDIWMEQIGNKKEERITITALIPNITLDIIGLVGFNYEFNSTTSDSELAQAYHSLIDRSPSPLVDAFLAHIPFIMKIPNEMTNRFFDSIKIINKISEKLVIEQKNAPIQGKDLLSLLVKSNEKLPADEQLTHNELVSQVMTLLIAGHETTSTALSWALHYLAKHPDAQDRLRKELVGVFIDRDHVPTFDEIDHLKYLDCVLKETLRVSSPVHHDPLIWGDDVDYFNPSRWLDSEIKSKTSNLNFFPFGAGPTTCLGMKMAQLEFKSILSIIIRNFEFKLVEGFTFESKALVVIRPDPGIDLLVSKVDY
ncbi:34193_t:CDS:2 [Gigaspora margarita]|uniref:34193_t:CDS:1 n=1 Tax=Gigaspora margarita TaxID=4874 RepID=A0ABN7UYR4_GIGMA|nr:34193_t:CDS:2 [Gigaspora margarita]